MSIKHRIDEWFMVHGYEAVNALMVQAEHMTKAADDALASYEKITAAGPEAIAAQDKTMVTTEGFKTMAEIFYQAADRARDAREALQDILDSEDL